MSDTLIISHIWIAVMWLGIVNEHRVALFFGTIFAAVWLVLYILEAK